MTATGTDKYEVAARIALAGLDDGRWHRLTAAEQRAVFGAYLFGKKSLRFDTSNQGRVEYAYSCCFGTDACTGEHSLDRIAAAVNAGHRLAF